MRIDSHQHFWVYNPREYDWIDDSMAAIRRDFLPHDLKPELERAGFQGSVAVQARQTIEETRWLLELAASSPFILGVVGWVDLQSKNVRSQLQTFAENPKLVGVRHIVQGEPDDRFLLRHEFMRGIAALEEFDLAYDILIYTKHLPVAAEFVRQFPRQRFVLDHLAKPPIKSGALQPWTRGLQELAAFPNVMCKLSGMVTEADWPNWKPEHLKPCLDVAVECFGPQRLMFGSDWPVCNVAAPYSRVMSVVKDYLARFSVADREAVMGGNAQRFWKLKPPESLSRGL
jgi:L-fuconolactonase